MAEIVGERALDDVVELAASETVGSALSRLRGAHWVAVVDDQGVPVCVAASDDLERQGWERHLRDLVLTFPPFVVVEDEMPVREAVRSSAFRTMDAESPVLVRRKGAVAGVWAGDDLAEAMLANVQARRFASDTALPGNIGIPQIVRLCGFAHAGRPCLDRRSFPEKPEAMPACHNPKRLPPHAFLW